jgi:hypothetical protein
MVFCKPTGKRARHKEDDARMVSLASIDKGKGEQAKLTPSATTTSGAAINGTGKGKGKQLMLLGWGVEYAWVMILSSRFLRYPHTTKVLPLTWTV